MPPLPPGPLAVLIGGRVLDLLGTWAATPDLDLESNAWMRRLGWRTTIVGNVVFVVGVALLLDPRLWITLGTFSALLGLRNAQLAWVARAVGASSYRESLSRWLSSTPLRTLLVPLLLESGILVLLGLSLRDGSTLETHPKLWYIADVGRGVLLCGMFLGIHRGVEIVRTRGPRIARPKSDRP